MTLLIRILLGIAALFVGGVRAEVVSDLPRTVADITRVVERRDADSARVRQITEVLAAVPPVDGDRDTLIAFHLHRAQVAASLGLVAQVLHSRRQLVLLTEGQRNQPKHLIDLAIAEMTAGNWSVADKAARRAAASPTGWWGQDVLAMMVLARMQSWLGDVKASRTQTDRAEELFRRAASQPLALQFAELVRAMIAWSKGDAALTEGRSIAAEASLRTAAKHAHADVLVAESRQRMIEWAPAPDSTWQLLDLIEAQLARVHAQQGRMSDAEQVARSMLKRNFERFGSAAPSSAVSLAVLGEVLIAQQRWQEAAVLSDSAASTLERSGAGAGSGYLFQAERVRIDSRIGMGDWQGALNLIDNLRGRLADESNMLLATERRGLWALAMVRRGRAQEASGWLSRLTKEHEQVFGSERYEVAETRGLLGISLAALGKREEAFEALVASIPILAAPVRGGDSDREDGLRQLVRRAVFEAWIGLLSDMQGSQLLLARGIDPITETFRIGDAMRNGSLQAALAASATRAMATTPQLGDLIRREQDGKREILTLNNQLGALALTPDSDLREKVVSEVRARIRDLEQERGNLFQRIEQLFPNYADLVSPRPVGIVETQKALLAFQSLVAIVPAEDRTFVWAVAQDGRRSFHVAPFGASEIALRVNKLRDALDPGDMDVERLRLFDYRAAHELYSELLAPVESVWGNARELVVVSAGSLGQLPLSILLTKSVGKLPLANIPFEEMKGLPWLARKIAVTNVPSANAFVRLRGLPSGSADRTAFIGFGDPKFGMLEVASGPTRGLRLRNLSVPRQTALDDVARADIPWLDYGSLASLPDTREELQSIARVLGADLTKDVFLGADASRRKVRQTDLSKRRIVAFATHGLVPGDLPGLQQPALALALDKDSAESPLLTLEDVLGLRLDADWVVLSACNTAAGDGKGADAVSGLGRGFFYAGSRALLVTHWPVETVSARKLVTDIFERYAKDSSSTRAASLQGAMLAMIDGPGSLDEVGRPQFSYAHPIFWAPYALYGDGSR